MKKIISIFLVALLAFSFSACGSSIKKTDIKYKENDSGYSLYRYKGASTKKVLDIPETYENKPVTELMDFSISNSEYLEVINIGENIEEIDVWALSNCQMLKSINVSENNKYFTSVDGVLYNKDKTVLIAYPNGKTPLKTNKDGKVLGGGKLVLPDTVKEIRENAFYLCGNIYEVKFNDGLEKIGNKAFLKCANLKGIDLPNTVKTIGVDAFSYCNSLKTLDIPSSVTSIGDYAFFSTASSLEKIVIHQKNADALELGQDWIPNKKNSVSEKIKVEYKAN